MLLATWAIIGILEISYFATKLGHSKYILATMSSQLVWFATYRPDFVYVGVQSGPRYLE